MYKSSPADINEFINDHYGKQEEFSCEEFFHLVLIKNPTIKEKDTEDLWSLISNNKHSHTSKHEVRQAFNNAGIECSEKEIQEMIEFINEGSQTTKDNSESFTKEDFKQFINL